MKNKIIVSLMCLFIFCTSFIMPVSATDDEIIDDTQYYGSFNGVEYPIVVTNPNMSLLYDVGGYTINNYYSTGSSYTSFNQSFSSTSGKTYNYRVAVTSPISCYSGNSYSIKLNFTSNTTPTTTTVPYLYYYDSSSNYVGEFYGTITSTSSGSFYVQFDDCIFTAESTRFNVYFSCTASSTTSSLVCTKLDINSFSSGGSSVDLGPITSILENIGLNINEIGVNVIAIRDYCISIIEAINLNFGIVFEKIDSFKSSMISKFDETVSAVNTIGSNIVSSINSNFSSLNTWIQNQTSLINAKLTEVLDYFDGNNNTLGNVINNNQTSNNANNTFNDYNEIESGYIDDMSTNLGTIDTTNSLFGMSDFIKTGTFVSTQIENIFNSNVIIQNMIMYSLILGLSLTVIGISTKRG